MYVIHIYIRYILHSIVYVKMTNVYSNELLFWGIAICQAGLMDRWSNGKDGTWVYPWCHPKNISCMRRTKVLQGNRSEVQDRRKPGHLTRHPFVDEGHIDRGFDFPQSIVLCCRLLATCNLMRLIQLSCTCSQFPRPWSLLEPRENAKGLALRKIVLLSGWSWCGDEALTKSLQGWCAMLFYPWWQGHRLQDINI